MLRQQKANVDQLNKEIVDQMHQMKQAIRQSHESELLNVELISKNNKKSEQIRALEKQVASYKEQLDSVNKQDEELEAENKKMYQKQIEVKDMYIQKLKERIEHLESQPVQKAGKEDYEGKYNELKQKFKNVIADLKEVETQKDRFRQQNLELKAELKRNKAL